jgi:hypothetical protein
MVTAWVLDPPDAIVVESVSGLIVIELAIKSDEILITTTIKNNLFIYWLNH